MAAAKHEEFVQQYRVVAPVTVIRKEKHERYLERGVVFGADLLDEANAEHLLRAGHIERVEPEGK